MHVAAASDGRVKVTELLVSSGASLDVQDLNGLGAWKRGGPSQWRPPGVKVGRRFGFWGEGVERSGLKVRMLLGLKSNSGMFISHMECYENIL